MSRTADRSPGTRSAQLPSAVSFDELATEHLSSLAAALGVPAAGHGPKAQRVAALHARMADGDFWDRTLGEAPELCLLVLEALCEFGGVMADGPLLGLVAGRADVSQAQVQKALRWLDQRGLVARMAVPPERTASVTALFGACAAALCARVRGASLPELPEDLASGEVGTGLRSMRDALVLAALTAHRRLRFTARRQPDRTTLRAFTRGLGSSDDEIFERLIEARALDVLGARGDRVVPRAAALVGVARQGRKVRHPRAHAWIGPTWVSSEALARAALRAELQPQLERSGGGRLILGPYDTVYRIADLRRRFLHAGPCEHFSRGGVDWIRSVAQGPPRGGDGHVTASFEILLGPAADLETCAVVALGAELVRLDRVLTLRLTPESVAAAIGCGLEADLLLAVLERVGRHGVPDNVSKLVREWACAKRPARVENGWFLFVDAATAAALERGPLASFVLGAPAPGVLSLAPSTPRPALEDALASAGWSWSATQDLEDERLEVSGALDPHHESYADGSPPDESELDCAVSDPPWDLTPGGTESVRACIRDGRLREFAIPESPVAAPLPEQPDAIRPADLASRLDRLLKQCSSELARFRSRLASEDRTALDAALHDPGELAPFLALRPKWRRRALEQARTLGELIETAEILIDRSDMRMSELGERVLDQLYRFQLERARSRPEQTTASTQPPPAKLSGSEVALRLAKALSHGTRVRLRATLKDGLSELFVIAERIVLRGDHQVLLGVDPETGEGRAIPLRDIHDVEVDG